ncbi:MAG: ABC transporter permease [Acidobacteriota bacterium]|jgi:putative ABC transport system permease protein|nr:ABC transporter permease [Acidobacteriota bacterium]|tara:strand:- start:3532 stop:4809 length:1278 start_codon:yes stop_codon:yes gene_type:complete
MATASKEQRRARRQNVLGIVEGINIALEAIWANKLRSFLTVLGNIIAVTSIILVVSIIQGLDAEVTDIFSSQGTDVFRIVRSGELLSQLDERLARGNPAIVRGDGQMLREEGTTFSAVVETAGSSARVQYQDVNLDLVSINGYSYDYNLTDTYGIAAGRYFSLLETRRSRAVAVLGFDTTKQLFPGLPPSALIDKRILINGTHFTIIGVHKPRGSILGFSQDEFINVPIGAYERLFGRRSINAIVIRPRDPSRMDEARVEASLLMRISRRLRPGDADNFGISSADTFVDIYRQATSGIYIVLVSVVSMSLIVGGIVVMNIMLMVVTERTKEIGIRKAVGATYKAVLWQFLVEAMTLSLAGGVFGMVLGYAGAAMIGAFTPLPYALAPWSIAIAIGVVTAVGVIFGIYPASRAAKLDPITALGYES